MTVTGIAAKSQYSLTGTASGSINVMSVQSLTLSGGTIVPSFTTLEHYLNGVTLDDYLNIKIKSNVPWTLNVQAQNAYFTPMSQGGSTDMPAGVLSIKRDNVTSFTPLSANSFTLKSGSKGGPTATGNTFNVDVKFNPGFNYKGGIYTLGLMYTLSQQ
jgi:hypothetical protein